MLKTDLSAFRAIALVVLLCATNQSATLAQLSSNCFGSGNGGFSIRIDTIAENIGSLIGPSVDTNLIGFNTYRLFLVCESPQDLLQAVSGDSEFPGSITTTTSFFQDSTLGAATPPNPILFSVYPTLEYDSYVTIGLDGIANASLGQQDAQLLEDSDVFPISIGFEEEGDLIMNSFTGSSWFIANAEITTNCAAGPDSAVLFAQLTTDGEIDGLLQFQVFRDGVQEPENCLRPYLEVNPGNNPGCTDSAACNYDPAATVGDGSCDFCSCPDTSYFSVVSFPSAEYPEYSVEFEVYADHDTTDIPSLDGLRTYRMYIRTAVPEDTVSAIYGNENNPLDIQCTTPFYHALLGASTPNGLSPLIWGLEDYKDAEFDSWVTVGIDRAPSFMEGSGYISVSTINDPNQNWQTSFDPGSGAPGSGFQINTNVGGSWFVNNPTASNGVPLEGQRVLIAQFTTDGIISGTISAQILPQTLPEGEDDLRMSFEFTTEFLGVDVVNYDEELCGCLADEDSDGICDSSDNCSDVTACNFNDPANEACQEPDALGVCGGDCTADEDNDAICDTEDNCTDLSACNFNDPANGSCEVLDALGACGGPCEADVDGDDICDTEDNCTDLSACNFNDVANTDCAFLDALGICGGNCVSDNNNNGICDTDEVLGCTNSEACNYNPLANVDDGNCGFSFDECGICGGPGAIYSCGCFEQPPIWCDCQGNTLDALGVCGGDCEADDNNNDICDVDEVLGCMNSEACNYNASANIDDSSCTFTEDPCDTCSGETDGSGTVVDNDTDGDGICDADEIPGCQDPSACNYNADATDPDTCTFVDGICETCEAGLIVDNDADDDGVCDDDEVTGCTDPTACNYDSTPTTDSDSTLCTFTDGVCETCVEGLIVDNDADNDDVCDADEVAGCTDPAACNYDSDPTTDTDNTLCTFTDGVCETCEEGLIVDNDADNDGVCDADEVTGCTDPGACNYDSDPTTDTDNTLCTYTDGICDTCVDGLIVDNDTDNDGVCDADEVSGCQDESACNYNAAATDSDGNCTFVDGVCETCVEGLIVDNDADNDGVCDADEVTGCTDPAACNYDSNPTTDSDNTLCTFTDGICDTCVDGIIVDNDADDDGICDADEVTGCTDPAACNYDSDTTTDTDNSLCTFTDGVCDTCVDGIIVDNDADNDGVCDADEATGCTDPSACNYDSDPTTDTDNTLCTFTDGVCDTCVDGIIVDNDADDDGVCDADEVTGCTDPAACNYDSDPTTDTDNSLCTFTDGICDTCVDGIIVDNDADDDGVCDADEVTGCTDPAACNYDSDPTTDTDNTLCTFTDGVCETCEEGLIVDNDADNDGVCDANEVTGCTDPLACNYDSDPTTDTDNTLCTFVDGVCETCEGGLIVDNDADNDGVCDADEVTGCTDPAACNYDSDPTTDTDNTLCTFVDGVCETCEGGLIVDNDADNDGVCDDDEVTGCTDSAACNYDSDPTTDSDNALCTFTDGICDTCVDGIIVDNDADDDGVCDADEVTGCTDPAACNYDSDPTTDTDNALCTFTDGICDTCVDGIIVDNDADDDGVCDADEVTGCTDPAACNYDSDPTTDTDNTLCTFTDGVCDTCVDGIIVDNDADNDGVCDADEVTGCTDSAACNYDSDPTTDTDNALCTFTDGICDTCVDGIIVDNDADDDGVCDADEVTGCTDPAACNYDSDPTTDTDNTLCNFTDGICDTCVDGIIVDNDADDDGVCDADEVTGCTDPAACNYDSDPTTDTDNTLCTFVDGVCETCEAGVIVDNDADDDGVCDANEVTGCTDPLACNYDSDPTTDTDNTLCTFVDGVCDTCVNGTVVDNDQDNDGVCDADETAGCNDPAACNVGDFTDTNNDLCTYVDGICETCQEGTVIDNDADNDGVCDADEVTGCTDPGACNYDSDPTTDTDNTLCTYTDGICDTCEDGLIVDNDTDNDGVCDADEVSGCQDESACNYNPAATDSDGNCTFVDGVCETCVEGLIVDNDADNDGVCDADEVTGCTDPAACNFDSNPTTDTDNTLCTFTDGICDTCVDGIIVDNDADDDGVCDADEVTGCTDPSACNYDSDPTTDTDNSLCTFIDGVCDTCVDGIIVDNDADNDGVCDDDEVTGCTDSAACNYDSDPTTDTDNTLCTFVDGVCETCEGGLIVDNDADNDGVCDANEVTGCTDPAACNYDSDPTTDSDNTLCTFVDGVCETCEGGLIVDNDADNDGVCDADEVTGCTDPAACNYDSDPTTDSDNTLCTFVDGVCETCEGGLIVDNDADNDGVCDADEVTGCTDPAACNYDSDPTTDTDNTLCTFVDGVCETCEAGVIVDNDADNDGVCDANEISGCTDPLACNYDSDPTTDTDNTLCTFVDGVCETCEAGVIVDNDADNDGICDADETAGCTDPAACNTGDFSDSDNSQCTYTDGLCETCVNGQIVANDADNDGVCDADEVTGCTDPAACNYDSDPTTDTDNTLCTFVDGVCETCEAGLIIDNDADNDGVCDADEVAGCQDETACNFDAAATDSNDSCIYDDAIGVCGGDCLSDLDNDGICDDDDPCVGQYDALGICNGGCPADLDNDDICDDVDDCVGDYDVLGICNGGCTADADSDGICDDVDDCVGEYDALGICNGDCLSDVDEDGICDVDEIPGCTDETACNFDASATDDDGSCDELDALDVCGGTCTADADEDGICDDVDACVGSFDALGDCNGNCPADLDDDGICDTEDPCIGSYDAIGVCNGDCEADVDQDGVCDDAEILGCTDPAACNFDPEATEDDSSCAANDALGECGGACAADEDEDGICDDVDDCVGQLDAIGVCNGDCTADTDGDGVCDSTEIFGCTDPTACNYNPAATEENGSCTVEDAIGVCGGDCPCDQNDNGICDGEELTCPDYNENGVCDGEEVFGCSYIGACNYDANVTADDGSCFYSEPGLDCDGNDFNDSELYFGCTYSEAVNYSAAADLDNGSCVFLDVITDIGPCYFDISNDGIVNTPDLLILLQYWEAVCE